MTAIAEIPRWDIFCKVVDNFGDAGVCWRIAKQLAREHGLAVRLWIDRPETLGRLLPGLDLQAARQQIDGVEVYNWLAAEPQPAAAAVVIEAFGCGLPDAYVDAMAAAASPPLWIVLEYLSAEDWVDSHHGLASPHPRLPLQRWYFFPGFTAATGGLPRERDLLARRDGFDAAARAAFWRSLGFEAPDADALVYSLFAYAHAPVADWLEALAGDALPSVVAVPEGVTMPAVRAWFGNSAGDGPVWRRGALEVRALPFLAQARYDELLWACDFNLVRGEDSFVRAQWAARPLVWQPYRQDDGAQQRKLDAFMQRYLAGLPPGPAATLNAFAAAWNGQGAAAASWPALRACHERLVLHARAWAARLAVQGELSAKLVEFARNKVK
jgi:uncharacterized repeat protein (TIGR03837 family)